jgi:hypothetical protein
MLSGLLPFTSERLQHTVNGVNASVLISYVITGRLGRAGQVIDAARQYAMNYTEQLPNYLFLEMVRRAFDTNISDPVGSEQWRSADTLALLLCV